MMMPDYEERFEVSLLIAILTVFLTFFPAIAYLFYSYGYIK